MGLIGCNIFLCVGISQKRNLNPKAPFIKRASSYWIPGLEIFLENNKKETIKSKNIIIKLEKGESFLKNISNL